MIHSHDDRKIKTCPICQKALRELIEAEKELDRLGTWTFYKPDKKKGGVQLVGEWK